LIERAGHEDGVVVEVDAVDAFFVFFDFDGAQAEVGFDFVFASLGAQGIEMWRIGCPEFGIGDVEFYGVAGA
jgi:hypothetical protein